MSEGSLLLIYINVFVTQWLYYIYISPEIIIKQQYNFHQSITSLQYMYFYQDNILKLSYYCTFKYFCGR